MADRQAVLPWVAVAVFVAALAALLALLYTGVLFSDDDDVVATTLEANEPVTGTKRIPGTYQLPSATVSAGEVGEPDVTIDVNVTSLAFMPGTREPITVQQGQVVKLLLHGKDDGQLPSLTGLQEFSGHGFQIHGPYDVWITGLRENTTREVVFKADVPGEFLIECVVLCGLGHGSMLGKFIVEEAR